MHTPPGFHTATLSSLLQGWNTLGGDEKPYAKTLAAIAHEPKACEHRMHGHRPITGAPSLYNA